LAIHSCEGQKELQQWLQDRFVSPTCTGDLYLSMREVNIFLRDWVMRRMSVDAREAVRQLETKWRLPVRAKIAAAADEDTEPAAAALSKRKTMAYRYLHRAVSHFYQRIGNKAVSAFATYVNEVENRGTLSRMRGTKTKYEVVFSPGEARDMLQDDAFITEAVPRAALLRALGTVFSSFGVLYRFTETGPTPGGARILTCLLGHLALVVMKVRQHLKMRSVVQPETDSEQEVVAASTAAAAAGAAAHAAGASAEEELSASREAGAAAAAAATAVLVTPALNLGHRAEWVQELTVLSRLLQVQGARASNGLRLLDGANPHRADPVRRPVPQTPTMATSDAGRAGGRAAIPVRVGGAGSSPRASGAGVDEGVGGPDTMADAPPGPGQDSGAEDSDGDEWFIEDEEEAPVRRRSDGGAAARRARLEQARVDAARVAAATVVLEEVD